MESCFHKPAKRIMDALLLLILGRRTRQDPLSGIKKKKEKKKVFPQTRMKTLSIVKMFFK